MEAKNSSSRDPTDDIWKKIAELERVQKYIDKISEETEEDEEEDMSEVAEDDSKPFSIIEEIDLQDVDLDDELGGLGPLSVSLSSDIESLKAIISQGQGRERTTDKSSYLDIPIVEISGDERSVDELLKEYEEFERNISLHADENNQSTNRSASGTVVSKNERKIVQVPAAVLPKPKEQDQIPSTTPSYSGLLDFSTEQFSGRSQQGSIENSPESGLPAPPPSNSVIERLNDQFSGRNKATSDVQYDKDEGSFKGQLQLGTLEEIMENEITRRKPKSSEFDFQGHGQDKIFLPQSPQKSQTGKFDPEKPLPNKNYHKDLHVSNRGKSSHLHDHRTDTEELKKLRSEFANQEAILKAYQDENEKLFLELKETKDLLLRKEEDFAEENSKLKTEIATLKITHRLLPAGAITPRSSVVEIERLNAQLHEKTQQIFELHREIAALKAQNNGQGNRPNPRGFDPVKNSPKTTRAIFMSQEKEAEYQKTIRNLQKQNRTLQKIIYHKDPNTKPGEVGGMIGFGSKDALVGNSDRNNSSENHQVELLENRISELESQLAKADHEAKHKLKEFTQQLNNLKGKYEACISELEEKNAFLEGRAKPPAQSIVDDMSNKLTKANNEITNLKAEISLYKRELEIASKASSQVSSTRQDASALSLAIKSFKGELAEKDKELLKLKKEIGDLKKTNLGLKREREKYLSQSQIRSNPKFNAKNAGKEVLDNKPMTGPGQAAYHLLQQTLEAERSEFEEVLMEKNKIIEGKAQLIRELKTKLDNFATKDKDDKSQNPMIQELRERLISQIKVITSLKTHLTTCATEINNLRKEKGLLEYKIEELSQELHLSKTLIKPENEILGELSRKVENLSSQYTYRERQIDSLLQRLSIKSSLPTRSNGLDSLNFNEPIRPPSLLSHIDKTENLLSEIPPFSPTSAIRLLGDDADAFLNLVN